MTKNTHPNHGQDDDTNFDEWLSQLSEESLTFFYEHAIQFCVDAGVTLPGDAAPINPNPMPFDEALELLRQRLDKGPPLSASSTHKPAVEPTDAAVNPEQVDHDDQVDIDAAFRDLLNGIDF